ncbi:hypothetical protein ACFO26_04870 [Lactococcus nasutitermitis]|uniref:Uncharacterized protein n=1 Tax=Lactococcus nasutitermitis TaxID=1652957 RepID=A0ABV9JFZ7_9LACT|nr:hypothetical protein [Lactococcus nasutitermitis]
MVKQKHIEHLNAQQDFAKKSNVVSWTKIASLVLLATSTLTLAPQVTNAATQTKVNSHHLTQKHKTLSLVKLPHSQTSAQLHPVMTMTKLTKDSQQIVANAKLKAATEQSTRQMAKEAAAYVVKAPAPAPQTPAPPAPAPATAATSQTSPAQSTLNSSGLDMSQTTGYVDIAALANYMASISTVSGFTAAQWAQVITRESGGQVDVWNAGGSPCYGVFQEWGVSQGTSLATQIQIAAGKPASAWAETI